MHIIFDLFNLFFETGILCIQDGIGAEEPALHFQEFLASEFRLQLFGCCVISYFEPSKVCHVFGYRLGTIAESSPAYIILVEDYRWRSPNREYTCFYREGDDLYIAYKWDLNPATEADVVVARKDIAYYTGLPAPQSGKYTMHFRQDERPTGITHPTIRPKQSPMFDLQGRQLKSAPQKGIYIQNGKKVLVK